MIAQFIFQLDNIIKVQTPLLHQVPKHLNQKFIRILHDDKAEKLLGITKGLQKRQIPTIIFW